MFWDFVFWLLNILTIVVEVCAILVVLTFVALIGFSVMNEISGTDEKDDQAEKRQ